MHSGGRPPMFETVDQLATTIATYFEQFEAGKKKRKTFINEHAPTITGLCLYCGFESWQSFCDYQEKPDFSYTIKRARLRIENIYEQALLTSRNVGDAIFALKNFGWKDEQSILVDDERKRIRDAFPEELLVDFEHVLGN